MQSGFWELANPSNPPLYPPMLINVKTLNMSAQRFSNYLKTEVIKSYIDVCIIYDCYVCALHIHKIMVSICHDFSIKKTIFRYLYNLLRTIT